MNRVRPPSILQRLLSGCLCLVLAWTGIAIALSCAGQDMSTQMVICGDEGAQVVWLDADGHPTKVPQRSRDCADCPTCLAAAVAADLGPRQMLPMPHPGRSESLHFHGGTLRPDAPEIPQTARGPPPATRA
jgi:hypothetical protein